MGKIKKLTDNIFIWIANWIKDHFVQKDNTEEVLETDLQEVELADVATSGSYNDLIDKPTIPSAVTETTVSNWGFTKNTGNYSKPSGGIPKSDLASAVQTSLGRADTALQSFTETDPTVPDWAKSATKPTYTASEVGARPSTWTPTKSDIGLGNVGNFKAVSTVANQGLSTTEQANSRNNINAQELLVSGTNIKTINGNSLLGNGNIVIEGGSGGSIEEVYIGTSEPTDPNIKMWIVPNGDADSNITLSEVEQLIDNKLNDILDELY